MSEKTYIVRNPRGIPKGIVILSWRPPAKPNTPLIEVVSSEAQDWYEGDTFAPPDGMGESDVKDWLESGFIEEVL